jgi:apolipoprotein D and lipocalin family protein
MKLPVTVFLTLLVSSSASAGWGFGWCPSPALQENFDITQYIGTWYEAARVKNIRFESGDCVSAEYSLNSDNTVKVVNTQLVDNAYSSREGLAYCESSKSGQCHVRFSSNQPWGDYEVIKTDYENFSIVYSCSNFYLAHYTIAWILARDTDFDPSNAIQALAGLGFDISDFYLTRQVDCPARS